MRPSNATRVAIVGGARTSFVKEEQSSESILHWMEK